MNPLPFCSRRQPVRCLPLLALLLLLSWAARAQAPTITSLSPSSGAAGSSFTLNGTNLNVGGLSVSVDGTVATLGAITATTAVVWVPTTIGTGAKQVMCSTNGGSTWPNFATFTITVPAPTITSFTPTSGSAADFTTVVINGTNFSGVTGVSFNNVAIGTWTTNSPTQLQTGVPVGATTGKIRITTGGGTAVSTADFTVTGTPAGPPTVTSFTPTLGVAGTTVTLTGTNFTGATSVKFNGTTTSTFTVNSATSITVNVPAGATTGKVSVANSGGFGTLSTGSFTVGIAPVVSSFTPTSGPVGTSVTISGTTLTGATAVKFNGVSAPGFTVNSATSITATVPAGATTGKVSVTTAFGTATSAANFTVAVPTVSSFTPTSGGAGTSVVISGTNLTGATGVKFNTTTATVFTVNSATQITATVPTGATTGKVSVTTPGGTALSAANFTVLPSPTITSFTPSTGGSGTGVNITGTNFTGATAVKFNTVNATSFMVNSATSITAYVPASASATGKLSVTTPNGTGQSATNFTYAAPPTITSFSPTSGTLGTVVTITGTNLTGNFAAARLGSNVEFPLTLHSSTSASFTITSNPGYGLTQSTAITLMYLLGGPVNSASQFTFSMGTMTASPLSGDVTDAVTLTATGLNAIQSVKFGTISATFTEQPGGTTTSRIFTAIVPVGAVTGLLTATDNTGVVAWSNFTVNYSLDGYGSSFGVIGQALVLNGHSLNGVSQVTFHNIDTSTATNAPTFTKAANGRTITVTVPATLPVGRCVVQVTWSSPAGLTTYGSDIDILRAPTISSFTPTSGGIGTVVTVNGTGLDGVTRVLFNGAEGTDLVNVSATQLTVKVPALASTGKIRVEALAGTAQSATNFTFTAPPAPTITSFTPTSGQANTLVTLTGTNLSNVTAITINGITTYPALTGNTATTLRFDIPYGATTGPIRVQTTSGSVQSLTNFTVNPATWVSVDSVAAVPGQQVSVPIRVGHFTSMLGFSGSVLLGAGAEFVSVTQVHASLASLTTTFANGTLRFLWYSANTPVTLADSTVVFALRFNVKAGGTPTVYADITRSDLSTGPVFSYYGGGVFIDPFYTRAPVAVGVQYGSATGLDAGNFTAELRNSLSSVVVDTQQVADIPVPVTLTGATGQSYKVVPRTTAPAHAAIGDLVRTHRHVLNLTPLGQNTKVLAADVDGSKSVTTTDVGLMADVLLGRRTTYPKGRSVRFFNAATLSASTTAPWTFDTTATVTSLTTAGAAANFIAVRLGDVTLNSPLRPAPTQPLLVGVADAVVGAGQTCTVPVRFGSSRTDLAGVQLTISWDAATLRLAGAAPALPGVLTFQPDAGHLTLVWTDAALSGRAVAAGDDLVHLTFAAMGPAGTTATITLSDEVTAATATNAALAPIPLTLTAGTVQIGQRVTGLDDTPAAAFSLWPNPAHDAVRISGAHAHSPLLLLDATGRIIRQIRLDASGEATLPLTGVPPGIYLLRGPAGSQRLVVQ